MLDINRTIVKPIYLLLLVFLTLGPGAAVSSAEKSTEKATTTANPEIPIDELELLLRPLTRSELETETQAWLKLLQDKISEISEADMKNFMALTRSPETVRAHRSYTPSDWIIIALGLAASAVLGYVLYG